MAHVCPCDPQVVFFSHSELERHQEEHGMTTSYPLQYCPYNGCEYSTRRKDTLKIHIRSHTNEKPYICGKPGCSKAYRAGSSLNKHRKSKHGCVPSANKSRGIASGAPGSAANGIESSTQPSEIGSLHDPNDVAGMMYIVEESSARFAAMTGDLRGRAQTNTAGPSNEANAFSVGEITPGFETLTAAFDYSAAARRSLTAFMNFAAQGSQVDHSGAALRAQATMSQAYVNPFLPAPVAPGGVDMTQTGDYSWQDILNQYYTPRTEEAWRSSVGTCL